MSSPNQQPAHSPKRRVSPERERMRETYRCHHCGRFIEYETDGFFDREDRNNEDSGIFVFCNESHADKFHAKEALRSATQ